MKFCLFCGKELSGKQKRYCSRSCSGKATSHIARVALAQKTLEDPEWHSRRSVALWKDEEYVKKIRSKTFDNEEWKTKYQSRENFQYLVDGYKRKYREDPEFRLSEIKKSLRAYKTHRSILYNGVYFRSSWEVRFATQLDENDIFWEYEHQIYDLVYTHYTPDFYLPSIHGIVEIKPFCFVNELIHAKMNEIQSNYHHSFIIHEKNWDNSISTIIELHKGVARNEC